MRRRIAVALVALIGVASCTGAGVGDDFDLIEFAIVGPEQVSQQAETKVTNSGIFPHTLVVTNSAGEAVAATPLLQPGESVHFTLDLDPGVYAITCRIVAETPDGVLVDHYEEGMAATVEITG